MLRRDHAEAIGEILLLLVNLLVQQVELVAQFFIGAGGLGQGFGEAAGFVFQHLDAAGQLLILTSQRGELGILVGLMLFFLVAGTEQLGL